MAAPKIIPFNVELRSVNPVRSFDRRKVYTNDLNSVEFQFKILDMTSTELTTATAVTLVYMRDGSFFANPSTDVSRVGNVFSYLLKENEGNHAGVAQIQLVVMVDGMELASQLFDFEIINGLETKVAPELMIQDWTTLTRDARAYINQFVADEVLRDAEFDNNQFDRNAAFNQSQTDRTTAYGIAEGLRDSDYEENEALRQAGYDADHSRAGDDHTLAGTDRTDAATDRTNAATDRTNAAADRTLAGTDHTRADADHTQALANNTAVAGMNTRVVAEETATAANKISAVKAKTFADVDARLEDLETDGALMASNLVTNGDFSNSLTGWGVLNGTYTIANNELAITPNARYGQVYRNVSITVGHKYYISAMVKSVSANTIINFFATPLVKHSGSGNYEILSGIDIATTGTDRALVINNADVSGWAPFSVKYVKVINLTAIFGAGKEPTAAEMDRLLARFTNSWFDGTKNLFAARTAIEKQIAIDSGAVMDATNLIFNPDFKPVIGGWSLNNGGVYSILNNEATITPTVLENNVGIYARIDTLSGNKYYICGEFFMPFNNVIKIYVNALLASKVPVVNSWDRLSGIYTAAISETQRSLGFLTDMSTQYALTNVMKVRRTQVINLTAAFGAGNEPTVEQMDAILAKFENSWFDGTKNLFQAKASLSKLMALDARTEFEMKNEVVNGDFSNGSTGWTLHSTASIINGVVNSVPTADAQNSYQYVNALPNRKYYIRGLVTGVSGFTLIPEFRDATSSYGLGQFIGASVPSAIINTPSLTTQIRLYLANNTARGTGTFDNITLIDLTAAFGAGKEPTLAEMDRLMARFPNSWFDGVKPIQTIETLYQDKAEKYQESWIAPTLLNAWINVGGTDDAAGYMKDSLGFVHLKGIIYNGVITAGTVLFTLPAGYRPSKKLPVMALTSGGVIRLDIKNTGEVSMVSATSNSWLTLNNLTFRAEV